MKIKGLKYVFMKNYFLIIFSNPVFPAFSTCRQKYPPKIGLYTSKTLEHLAGGAKSMKVDLEDMEELPKESLTLLKDEDRRAIVPDPAALFGQDDQSLMLRVRAERDRADYIASALGVMETSKKLMEDLDKVNEDETVIDQGSSSQDRLSAMAPKTDPQIPLGQA